MNKQTLIPCSKCLKFKPKVDFRKHDFNRCRKCISQYRQKYYKINKK